MNVLYQNTDYPFITVTITDIFFLVALFALVTVLYFTFKAKAKDKSAYKYFFPSLIFKMFASLSFGVIYLTAYGGDTLSYFHNMQILRNLLLENPSGYLDIILSGMDSSNFYLFNSSTGLPSYMWDDPASFIVSRILSPIALITNNSFLGSTVVVGMISFIGNWKMYKLFAGKYPAIDQQMAIAALFIPSVLFWGSGIMKDTIVVFALSFLLSGLDKIIKLNFSAKSIIYVLLSAFIIVNVKPYIFVAILPTIFIWIGYGKYQNIQSRFLKYFISPLLIIGIFLGVFFTYSRLATDLGQYGSFDTIVDQAKVVQGDLFRNELYGENKFYIGEITGSTSNLIGLFPKALLAGLFRPYLWESKNIFMLMSGLENFFILLLVFSVFFRRKVKIIFQLIGKDPFLLGLLVFIIFLAYGVGISTANFGALVRYRIPLMPMLVSSMFIIKHYHKQYLKQFETKTENFFIPFQQNKK